MTTQSQTAAFPIANQSRMTVKRRACGKIYIRLVTSSGVDILDDAIPLREEHEFAHMFHGKSFSLEDEGELQQLSLHPDYPFTKQEWEDVAPGYSNWVSVIHAFNKGMYNEFTAIWSNNCLTIEL